MPSIHYMVLRGYARSDSLRELCRYDNGDFLKGLDQRGFCVAEEASANYSHTPLSLSSSLNMEYLNGLTEEMGRDTRGQESLGQMIAQSRVRRFSAQRGYRFASICSAYFATQIDGADIDLTPDGLSEPDTGLQSTTPIASPARAALRRPRSDTLFAEDAFAGPSYYATAARSCRLTAVTDLISGPENRIHLERLRSMDYFPDDIEIDARDDSQRPAWPRAAGPCPLILRYPRPRPFHLSRG